MSVGVIVARFQVPELHTGHRSLIGRVREHHDQVAVLLGIREAFPSARNPLDFSTRAQMLTADYPDIHVWPFYDCPASDRVWSTRLDQFLTDIYGAEQCVLYSSRDSFSSHYYGTRQVVVLESVGSQSGTAIRQEASAGPRASYDFRAGVIYGVTRRFPLVFPTVDVAIVDHANQAVLLGHKPSDEAKWRLIGGFVDPQDDSFEAAARREVYEETGGMEVDDFRALGSLRIADLRYADTDDRVMTTLFVASYIFGTPVASSDLDAVRWFPFGNVQANLSDMHREPWSLVEKHLANREGSLR